jgi:hypothetical protein
MPVGRSRVTLHHHSAISTKNKKQNKKIQKIIQQQNKKIHRCQLTPKKTLISMIKTHYVVIIEYISILSKKMMVQKPIITTILPES